MTDPIAGEEPSAEEEEPAKSGWASLNSDTRLLVVTVGGTLIANIATVMVVALSVWLLHVLNSPVKTHEPELLAIAIVPGAILASTVLLIRAGLRTLRLVLYLGPFLVLALIYFLALLGKAAGVK